MRLVWRRLAQSDLAAIRRYVAADDPEAARRLVLRLLAATVQLATHSHMGRPGRVPGTRELVVPGTPYILPYRVVGEEVQILRVYHTARRWPHWRAG